MRRAVPGWLAILGVGGLGAVNFLVGLGASSLYIDEGLSWSIASQPLSGLLDRVKVGEITPPTYYAGLHEWIGRVGSTSEVVMRLPSALAAIVLVPVVMWVGWRLADRAVAVLAGLLTALSPLLMEYAQLARAYAFAVLLCTFAVGAYLEFERASAGTRARWGWLAAFALSSVAAVWSHYTAGLVVLPLLGMGLARRRLQLREAIAAVGVTGVGLLALLPILRDELGQGNQSGVAAAARLTVPNLVQIFGTPFDGRFGGDDLSPTTTVGAVILTGAALAVLLARDSRWERVRSIALPLAYLPLAAVLVLTAAGTEIMITRYTAVASPLLLVVLAAGVLSSPKWPRRVVSAVAVAIAAAGSVAAHTNAGHYGDVRGAMHQVISSGRAGDYAAIESPAHATVLSYYLRDHPEFAVTTTSDQLPYRMRRRVWILQGPPSSRAALTQALKPVRYRPTELRRYSAGYDEQLVLAAPERPRRAP